MPDNGAQFGSAVPEALEQEKWITSHIRQASRATKRPELSCKRAQPPIHMDPVCLFRGLLFANRIGSDGIFAASRVTSNPRVHINGP